MTKQSHQEGKLHPMSEMVRQIIAIFQNIGYDVADGPEIETEFYNFDVLNVPADHPARDMQDTFWLKTQNSAELTRKDGERTQNQVERTKRNAKELQRPSASVQHSSALLRTHMTAVTVRYLESHRDSLPVRVIAPGKVYRNEATDSTHEAQFFQLDGAFVDSTVSLSDLKGTLEYFFKKLLGNDVKLRFRPSYFPFVEPGVEIDIEFRGKWLEVMGAGMLHPNVLRAIGVDSLKWRGFAFGGGIDRLLMIKHQIPDVRLLYSADLRLISQF